MTRVYVPSDDAAVVVAGVGVVPTSGSATGFVPATGLLSIFFFFGSSTLNPAWGKAQEQSRERGQASSGPHHSADTQRVNHILRGPR